MHESSVPDQRPVGDRYMASAARADGDLTPTLNGAALESQHGSDGNVEPIGARQLTLGEFAG